MKDYYSESVAGPQEDCFTICDTHDPRTEEAVLRIHADGNVRRQTVVRVHKWLGEWLEENPVPELLEESGQ